MDSSGATILHMKKSSANSSVKSTTKVEFDVMEKIHSILRCSVRSMMPTKRCGLECDHSSGNDCSQSDKVVRSTSSSPTA
jgi:transcription elongation factor